MFPAGFRTRSARCGAAVVLCALMLGATLPPAAGRSAPAATTAQSQFDLQLKQAPPGAVVVAPRNARLSLALQGYSRSPAVIIRGGVFTSADLRRVTGLHFQSSRFEASEQDARDLVHIGRASDITFSNVQFTGAGKGVALKILDSRKIAIRDSQIAKFVHGIRSMRSSEIAIQRNKLREVLADGIAFVGVQDLLIERNSFDWRVAIRLPHPDAIQISDTPNFPTRDIAIVGNTLRVPSQGIFVKSEKKGGFDRVRIIDNDIATDYHNGLHLSGARDSQIQGNRVQTLTGTVNMAKIVVLDSSGIAMVNNKSCKNMEKNAVFSIKSKNELGWGCRPLLKTGAG